MIRVVIVDDEALVRSGFEMILNAAVDIEVVASATGAQAVATIEREHPHVVLLDIRMPDMDGLAVLDAVRDLTDPPVVAMLTTFDSDEYIVSALRSGAAGFVLKDTEPELLARLVRTLAAGGVVLSPKASAALLSGTELIDTAEVARIDLLTDRERKVLTLLAEGLSNAEIGHRVHLSVGTVKDTISAIFTKLRVTNRVTAALLAQRGGLLSRHKHEPR
ncbi:response regulator [Nocardia pseudovaccinii]|uniref:response regulator n=1 Tax=Nocardia pseudovaccinii TaxID=189540 RepID=UPI003D8DA5B9